MRLSRPFHLLTAAAVLGLGVVSAAATGPSFRRLGALPSTFPDSAAHDVSADGTTVVGASRASGNTNHAFRWTLATGMVDIGTFPGQPSTTQWVATSVNADGSAIAAWGGQQPFEYSFRWRAGQPIQAVGPGPGVGAHVEAHGISAAGDVIVGWVGNGISGDRAYRWTPAGGLVTIGTMSNDPNFSYSRAYGVSADGATLVGSSGDPSFDHAFRWRAGSGFQDLGLLPDAVASRAVAASADGNVVAGFNRDAGGVGYRGFRWTEAAGMVALDGGYPLDMSADGSVLVGGTTEPGFDGTALLWLSGATTPINLETLLLAAGVDLQGMSLRGASGVSADGQTIVGWGYRLGRHEAFLATIPEPGTALFLVLGAGLLRHSARRAGTGRSCRV